MGWFKKKKEGKKQEQAPELPKLPELPEFPKLPKMPKLSESPPSKSQKTPPEIIQPPQLSGQPKPGIPEIKSLPPFPDSMGEDFSQEAVKSAISPPPSIQEKPKIMKGKRTLEIAEWEEPKFSQTAPRLPKMPKGKKIRELSTQPSVPITIPKISKKIEPVYIRIDKFKSAVQSFQEIQDKLSEVEELLKDIREIKHKEDEELREWEQELEIIKARIDSIDNNIFSKLD